MVYTLLLILIVAWLNITKLQSSPTKPLRLVSRGLFCVLVQIILKPLVLLRFKPFGCLGYCSQCAYLWNSLGYYLCIKPLANPYGRVCDVMQWFCMVVISWSLFSCGSVGLAKGLKDCVFLKYKNINLACVGV